MSNKCPKCSSVFNEKTKFCKICGCNLEQELIENPTCPKCNAVFSSDIKFCINDGVKLVHPDKLIPKCKICNKSYTNGAKFCPNDGGQIMLEDEIIQKISPPIKPVSETIEKQFQEVPQYSNPIKMAQPEIPYYNKADLGKRFLAYLLDGLIILLLFIPSIALISDVFIGYFNYGYNSIDNSNPSKLVFGFILLLIPFIYAFIKDGLGNGQSYGKRAMNLMVVNVNSNRPCSKSNSIGRNIMFIVFSSVPYIGWLIEVIMVFANQEGRKLSDLVAGTQVIDASEFNSN
jgi:uncharacterized RDD family membrane protein YckC